MTKNKSFFSNRYTIIIFGILIYILLFIEFFLSINQPFSNLGFGIDFYEPDFYVTKVVKDTPAYNCGINSDTIYYSINNTTVNDIIEYRKSVSEEEYKEHYSDFFSFGDTVNLKDYNGNTYSFTLEKLSLLHKIRSTSLFVKLKFFIGMFMILCGLGILIFLNTDKTVTPLIYGLYFIGITTCNLFDSEFSSRSYYIIATVFLDIGLFFTFTCIFQYFYEIFTYTKHKNFFSYLRYIPSIILILKYIHIVAFKWSIVLNPFYIINSYITVFCCLIFIITFFIVNFTLPKKLTTTFKFFIIGLAFAVIPLLIDHFCYVLTNSIFMKENEKIYSVIPFSFVPFMLIIAALHNRTLIKTRIAALITSYFAFITISAPLFVTLLEYQHILRNEYFALFYVLISPLIIYYVNKAIIKFYSLNTEEDNKKLANFMQLISPITDTLLLHKVTTREIVNILDCSYVFFYKKTEGMWQHFYTWGTITDSEESKKLSEAENKIKTTFYKDGSFSIPIVRESQCTGVIYIGPKANGDLYLPGEHLLIVEMIKGFHKHYLEYTNNNLVQELKLKNNKMVEIQNNTILSMANLIESRDGGTGAHVKRTAEYSVLIAKRAKEKGLFTEEITDDFINLINKAAPMHDIGKIVVSDAVLKKPGKLTTEEFEEMKLHTTEGNRIVQEVLSNSEDPDYIYMTSRIAMYHHEKWNGTGYPSGLKENEIPLCARILAIADVFDALVSPRCYKTPMDPEKAFSIIKEDAGKHFDPVLAEVFLEFKNEALEIMKHEFL